MGILSIILLFLGLFSIYLSLEARESQALKMTRIADELYLSCTFMTSSMFVVAVLAMVCAWKNPIT